MTATHAQTSEDASEAVPQHMEMICSSDRIRPSASRLACALLQTVIQEEICRYSPNKQARKLLMRFHAELEAAAAKLDAEVAEVRGRYEAAAAKLQERRKALLECDHGIAQLAKQRAELERESTDAAVNKKKLEHKCVPVRVPMHQGIDMCGAAGTPYFAAYAASVYGVFKTSIRPRFDDRLRNIFKLPG